MIDYIKISPNSTNPRKSKIKKITIHHVAGIATVEQIGEIFAKPSRKASSNYGIDSNGRIGKYVEEENRAWTSGNAENDNQAITIEVSNDSYAPNWTVSDKAMQSLITLCVDICKRNGIKALNFTGDKSGNLTMHKYFQATACPGPYLESKFPYIAEEVNKILGVSLEPSSPANYDILTVDGYWGDKTTLRLQQYFGTIQDGIISKPSLVIKEIQKVVGAKVDGYLGNETITKMQIHFGTTVDGVISKPSQMVKAMQTALNNNTF